MNRKLHDPIARSIHDRLLNLAVAQKEDFNAVLVRYGNERLLYLLTTVQHFRTFLEPVLIAINSRTVFDGYWPPVGPWGKRRA